MIYCPICEPGVYHPAWLPLACVDCQAKERPVSQPHVFDPAEPKAARSIP